MQLLFKDFLGNTSWDYVRDRVWLQALDGFSTDIINNVDYDLGRIVQEMVTPILTHTLDEFEDGNRQDR